MEEILESLTGFAEGFKLKDLSEEALHQTKCRLVDSVGCLLGGMASPPSVIARQRASYVTGKPAATVAGLATKSTLEMAAFANTVMLRFWDINDTGYVGGHLSEMLPGVLAAADAAGSDGASVVLASAVCYELQAALSGAACPENWDYASFIAVSTALTAGKLLGLTREQLGHAAAIAAISNLTTMAARRAKVSMWVGCGSAAANRNGVFAALLAGDGMTGPEQPFVGDAGIMHMVTKERFTLDLALPYKEELAVQKSAIKFFPIQDDAQGPVEMMLRLRERVSLDEIESIRVDSFHTAWTESGERLNPNKWDPKTREMADKSLPYTLAVALVDGALNLDSFSDERIKDPALRPVMELITIYLNKEFRSKLPAEKKSTVAITLRSGEVVEEHTSYPHGHPKNPPTDEELNEKFDALSRRSTGDKDIVREIRDTLWHLESVKDTSTLFENLGRLHSYS